MTKYYIVSEAELDTLVFYSMQYGLFGGAYFENREKAKAACRSRPVPEWAVGVCSEPIETSSDYPIIEKFEVIER